MEPEPDGRERIMGLPPRVWQRLIRSVESGRIIPYVTGITIAVALVMALVMRLADPASFPTFGTAVWFSVVTLMTVGYGDVVPTDAVGRVFAGVLMVAGISFLAIVTAVVTSSLVSAEQRRRERRTPAGDTLDALERIERRLDAIERRLSG